MQFTLKYEINEYTTKFIWSEKKVYGVHLNQL